MELSKGTGRCGFLTVALILGASAVAMGSGQETSERRLASSAKIWSMRGEARGPSQWRAHWIWRADEDQGKDRLLLARKRFFLKDKPAAATLFISADTQYELFVNGTFANRGPARSSPAHQSYDILNVASLLSQGENVLSVRVWHSGRWGSHGVASRPGLLTQLEIASSSETLIVGTDSSWRVHTPKGWEIGRGQVGEHVDLRKDEGGWQRLDFDDSRWQSAEGIVSDKLWPAPSDGATPRAIVFPWLSLHPRDIPYLDETPRRAAKTIETGEFPELQYDAHVAAGVNGLLFPTEKTGIEGKDAYRAGTGPLVITTGIPQTPFSPDGIYSPYVVLDLGELAHGYTRLDIEGPQGTLVDLVYAPHLVRGKFPLRAAVHHRPFADRLVLAGTRVTWESTQLKYFRYLLVAVRNTERPVSLHFAGMMKSDYPLPLKGSFSAPSAPGLEWLWRATVNTLRQVVTDAYTDNYRERLQYAQTSYYPARTNYFLFGDPFLQRRYLTMVAREQQSDGVLPASSPALVGAYGRWLDASLLWVMGLHDHFLYSGDRITAENLTPSAEKLFERFRLWEDSTGLVDSPPYSYWFDHAPLDRRGASFPLNALYLLAMQDHARTLGWLGRSAESRSYLARVDRLRLAMRSAFWDRERKVFSDAKISTGLSPSSSEHTNSLAIVTRVATPAQTAEIAGKLMPAGSKSLTPVCLFMNFVIDALFTAGQGSRALAMLDDRYKGMRDSGMDTIWEDWSLTASARTGKWAPNASRSNVQAENTFAGYSLARWVLGVRPVVPGMKEIWWSFVPTGLPLVSGSIPTPSGTLAVKWQDGQKAVRGEVDVPPGIQLKLNLTGTAFSRVFLDGKAMTPQKVSSERLVAVPAGKHIVEIRK